ncbi:MULTISPECIES: TetR/AcrR family transcriptional regulator [unclassified Crossiella]|uniref:TetR/AcrR family transcriptional regulator n=1 Tax=unclassified Crossiella TaxID=2620835 RepID=UPI0020001835|nr:MULTISPECIES: TetR/AcrR family transcriptional regulator [unclassified Crossiella]MCK2238664.1 TetR/AcrR family transcriptional regulator [Crossiella sp. S99.2]MCK2251766.1 TetR/AcrR family transcriptional regulator [Crossiella sp. S99.1]
MTNNRESLLVGAKQCLYDKGYARTTARDIARASGVSLAAIGYHFGSTQELLNQALYAAIQEWGDELEATLAAELDPEATVRQRFETYWERVLGSFHTHRRMWVATFEIFPLIDELPQVRANLAQGMEHARLGLAELLQQVGAGSGDARQVGAIHQALLSGILAQWLIDPEAAPSAAELSAGLRRIAQDLADD